MFFKKYWAVILVAVVAAAVVYYYHKKQKKSESDAKTLSLGLGEILPGASAVPQTGGIAGGLDVETSDI